MVKKRRFSTTIKRIYWDQKIVQIRENVKHGYNPFFIEYKNQSKFWNDRIGKLKPPCPGVFLIGSVPVHVTVVTVDTVPRDDFHVVGNDLFTTPRIWAVKCELNSNEILHGGENHEMG